MKRITTFIIFLFLCADCLAQQDPVQVVRTYITTLNDALSSPNDMTRRRKIENLLGAGSPGIKDEIVERYNTKSTSRMLAGPYLAIFYDVIQNSSTAWIKVSILGTPTVKEDRGTSVCATLQYSGAISLKTSSEFWIENGKITGIMSDELGIAEISRNGGNSPDQQQPVQQQPTQQRTDNHPTVDLGLPSGTIWATCNVGAANPEDAGDYFAWGETTTKSIFLWSNYKYANQEKLTKYCAIHYQGNNGFTDRRTILEKSDDVAYRNWGEDWCMPTHAQFQELKDECTRAWKTINGKNGYELKGPNGNTIFFPAAGCIEGRDGKTLWLFGTDGIYWSSTLDWLRGSDAYTLHFNSSSLNKDARRNRSYGLPVRPVRCSN